MNREYTISKDIEESKAIIEAQRQKVIEEQNRLEMIRAQSDVQAQKFREDLDRLELTFPTN